MSGLEVCEKIREKFPMCDLPVIMVSAKGKPENIAEVFIIFRRKEFKILVYNINFVHFIGSEQGSK